MKPKLYRRYTDGAEFVVGGGWLRPEDRVYLREVPASRRAFRTVLTGKPSEFVRSFALAEFGELLLCVSGNGRRGAMIAQDGFAVSGASDYAARIERYRADSRWSEVR